MQDVFTDPVVLQAGINLIHQLYDVTPTRSLQKFLRRETDMIPFLLEAHYLARQYFDEGLPIHLEIFRQKTYEELIITIFVSEAASIEEEQEVLDDLLLQITPPESDSYSILLARIGPQ